ncbi:MAG: LacI family transcriptional regulator [Spirochaetaceae bacterium]|jgi:LacI family transcriptional regulator|nr:LacI family transcriptional regulator [Spirochaetaceae bacterium]
MGITQKDIARELKISLISVNRAFNNSGYVSAKLKKRILDYAEKRSYVPHRASQVLVRNKTRTIAVFSSTGPEYFWNDINKGVLNAAEHIKPFNYEVRYHRIPDFDTKKYIRVLQEELNNGLDAAAFVNQQIYNMDDIIGTVEKAEIPYLLFNTDSPESRRLCYIGADYRSGGRLAANFIGKSLCVKPRARVLVIGINEDERCAVNPDINAERLRGFMEVMNGQYPRISCQIEYNSVMSKMGMDDQIGGLLEKYEHRVDAVYFIHAHNASFLKGLGRFDYGKAITLLHDVDDSALRSLDSQLLTAVVYQDPVLQGYTAVRTLEHILESKTRERLRDIEIAHTLIFRENTQFLRTPYPK